MKVLMVHNYYGSSAPSGENQVFESECALLRSHGHEVVEFTRHSDEIRGGGTLGLLRGALSVPANPWVMRAISNRVAALRPDVVHVHNTFPLISPAVFYAIGGRAARVLTLHNYRLFCPAAIPMRAGAVCTECMDDRSVWPSLRHGCYRGSRTATLPLAVSVAAHRALETWSRRVDAFIALSDFQRERMAAAGLPADRIAVKPNFYPESPAVVPWRNRSPYVVFVGRLSREKGVLTLIEAWRRWGAAAPELHVVGDGELRPQLEALSNSLPVRYVGQVSAAAAESEIAKARLLVLPSEWFEGFPMVVREAFAFGTPAAVSDLGPLPSIVEDSVSGLVFHAGDPAELLDKIRRAWETPMHLERLGHGARRAFEEKYTAAASYRTLMSIYDAAIAQRCKGRSNVHVAY